MPFRTGDSSMTFDLPILPRPSARSVPRWRCDWLISLRTCVTLSFGNCLRLLHGRRFVRQHLADLLAARLGDFLRAAQLAERLLRSLQHVDRVRRAERLREDVVDPAELEHRAHAA